MFSLIAFVWLMLCVAVGVFAHYRRYRNGFAWFCGTVFSSLLGVILIPLGGLLFPLAMLIFVAILPPRDDEGFDGGRIHITE